MKIKGVLKAICLVAITFMVCGCNPASKLQVHGIKHYSMPDTRSIVLGIDAQNDLGLNVYAADAAFELKDNDKVVATATLRDPVKLQRKRRQVVYATFDLEFKGLFATVGVIRKALKNPEEITISGEVVGKCMGIKKKKVLAPQSLSKIMSNFAGKK